MSCNLVRYFQVLQFQVLQFRILHFHVLHFHAVHVGPRHFHVLRFHVTPSGPLFSGVAPSGRAFSAPPHVPITREHGPRPFSRVRPGSSTGRDGKKHCRAVLFAITARERG